MPTHRRGILAALLCSPAFLRAERVQSVTTIDLPEDFILKVRCNDKTVTLTSQEIIRALSAQVTEVIGGPWNLR